MKVREMPKEGSPPSYFLFVFSFFILFMNRQYIDMTQKSKCKTYTVKRPLNLFLQLPGSLPWGELTDFLRTHPEVIDA